MLSEAPFVNSNRLQHILKDLLDIEFIEMVGRTSGMKYVIHSSKLSTPQEGVQYLKQKRQDRFRQAEIIIRYLEEIKSEIDNETARQILNLSGNDIFYVSRLLKEMVDNKRLESVRRDRQKTYYSLVGRLQRSQN